MGLLDFFRRKKILELVKEKHRIQRLVIYLFACFFVALTYNVFFVKNNLVIGGMSGLAIVVKQLTGLSTGTFLIISTLILLFISYLMVGIKETSKGLIGAIVYPVLVSITEPLSNYINIEFSNFFFTIILATLIYGIFLGIVYKVGYSTGGADIINAIIVKHSKISIGTAGMYINIVIIFIAMFVFGVSKSVYAIFILLCLNKIEDFIILGNSDSKLCIIKAKNTKYIEKFLYEDFNIGFSLLETKGGVDTKKRNTIMCVVTSREYYRFKNLILDIDPKAFFVTHNCYEVLGGKSKRLIDLS